VPYSQEVKSARIIQQEAEGVVRNIMHDVRLGRSIQSDRVKKAVSNMVDSILRNEDALLSLTRIRKYDEYTFVHSLDVCIFCLSMARHMSLSRDEMLDMGIGALLHDCGKMKIPLQILNKPEALSANDWVEVRKHPLYSREIMEKSPGIPERSKELALQHHERFNGAGYPFGLQGDGIGIFGQVAGIVDFYDAITADRPYRKALQPHEGIRQIYERCQVEFSGFLVERFIQCIGIYPFGTLVLLDTEEMGIVCGVNSETLLRPKVLVIYRNSKTPYAQPFLVDLVEKSDQAFKRTIIMPLDAQKWNIQVEAYLSEIRKNLNSQTSS
jgi:HD-GYP domain-containing protein (c-di-GMP phosphodiesterase class II)